MRSIEAMVPSSGKPAKGDCYKAAFDFLGSHADDAPDDFVLVHGNVASLRQDQAVNHAWVEEDDVVHEVSQGLHIQFAKDDYYERLGVKNVRRYGYEEAIVMVLRYRHYGPWDD